MNKTTVGLLIGVALLAFIGGYVWLRPNPTVQYNPPQAHFTPGTNVTPDTKVGAIPGLEVSSDCFTINGVRTCSYRTGLITASTTICAIPKPNYSTSTLVFGSVELQTGFASSAAKGSYIDMAVVGEDTASSTAHATTSNNVIGTPFVVFSGGPSTIYASSSGSSAVLTSRVNFGKFLVKISDSAAGSYAGFAPTGVCQATWRIDD